MYEKIFSRKFNNFKINKLGMIQNFRVGLRNYPPVLKLPALTVFWNLVPKSEFQCRNQNFDSKIKIWIGFPMLKLKLKSKFRFQYQNRNQNSNFDIKILTKSIWNFIGVSILSKVKNQNRNSNFYIEIKILDNQNI
jgi:hypothetical protein